MSCNGRSRTTIDPRTLANAGTGNDGFSPTRQALLAPSPKRNVRRWASHMISYTWYEWQLRYGRLFLIEMFPDRL